MEVETYICFKFASKKVNIVHRDKSGSDDGRWNDTVHEDFSVITTMISSVQQEERKEDKT